MRRILVIESSATLRHVLVRLLRDKDFTVEQAASAEAGLEWFQNHAQRGQYDAVVFGWPKYTSTADEQLLIEWDQSTHADQPIVVLCEEADSRVHGWVARRKAAALLYWDNYSETLNIIQKLVKKRPRESEGSRAPLEQNIKILFVDDSPSVRTYYQRLLTRNGYDVVLGMHGEDALQKAQSQYFDIAIVDFFMPGYNGDELCRRLRGNPATAQITSAIFTGAYMDNIIQKALEAGAVECMFKNEVDQLFLARIAAMSRLVLARKTVDAERKRLESILSSVGEGVYGVNKQGKISFINPAAKRIVGFASGETLIGKSPYQLFHHALADGKPIEFNQCRLTQAYKSGEPLQAWETVFWHCDGRAIPVECTVQPLVDASREIRGSVVAFRDISERKGLENRLRWQATHDTLTQLFNRRYFEEQLEQEVNRLHRSEEYAALLYIDLDRFKYINDTVGHAAGDSLLVEVSRQLKSRLRESDVLARLGGDEFAVILRNIEYDSILDAAESFRDLLNHCSFHYEGKSYKINGSIGVAIIGKDTMDAGEILANADFACNLAKTKGRNQTHIYRQSKDEKSIMDLELGWSTRLREALQKNLFVLNFQPILKLSEIDIGHLPSEAGKLWELEKYRQINHFEVLVRLPGTNGHLISPHAFIPTAERFNLMQDIDMWVLDNALMQLARIRERRNAVFSINLSGHSMGSTTLSERVIQLLTKYEVDPKSVIFEITETSAIENLEVARSIIKDLKDCGCRFALDDFGTGFSSFSQLKHLPVDYIKIDGSFVQGMHSDQIDQAMVASINDIAHSLGRKTVAEFVENAEVLRMLKDCGVDYVQGHYISPPLLDVVEQESEYCFSSPVTR